MIRYVEDRGFDIQSAPAAKQKREPVTHVSDERFSPRVERSTRRPAFSRIQAVSPLPQGATSGSE
ncbi:hypothetical protein B9H04_17745 [Halorubrum ezzemoulense DSM 17463]|uniref:Uncharacterized protein n=1 Tax=Halorubrum ezzemoulense DSM 17463 TaxID=1121945 RepID=A0A1X4G301_HALEZ|nr:hypothetical protein B9H04_17745 [Halorubrum ezzemoulense DSM 17463]